MEKRLQKFGNGGLGYYDKQKNTFIVVKQPYKNEFNLKEIVKYLNEKGFTTSEHREIKPEQCTGGNGLAVFYKGIGFYIYLNDKKVRKIHTNEFKYNYEAYKIINKIVRLINSFVVVTETKGRIRAINKKGKVLPKRLPKLKADYIYGDTVFENKDDALNYNNKLQLNENQQDAYEKVKNGIHCSVTNMVAYWNKTVHVK